MHTKTVTDQHLVIGTIQEMHCENLRILAWTPETEKTNTTLTNITLFT